MNKIKVANPVVELDGDEMTRIIWHFIKEKLDAKVIDLSYISSKEQTADVMTKSLTQEKFEGFIGKLGMINIYSPV